MKKNKKFEKWIRKQIDYYLPILELNLNKVDIRQDNEQEYLGLSCTYPYLDPRITYSDSALASWNKGEMKKDRILHELCHIITDPLYVKAIQRHTSKQEILDERERLTDTISAIIRKQDEKE